MGLVVRLIMAGIPAAKLIAKYGKKAYDAAKKSYNKLDKAAEKSKIIKKINKPIFEKSLKKDIKVKGKELPTPKGNITWKQWKDVTKRQFLETTPGHISIGVGVPLVIAKTLKTVSNKIRSSKDKKFTGHSNYKE